MGVYINGQEIGNECFPNNERILRIPIVSPKQTININFVYGTDIDISILMMTKYYLDDKYPLSPKTLTMLYVPYSRMDRDIEGYMFSLKYFCQFINSLKFSTVYVADVHSNMTLGLLNCVIEKNLYFTINPLLIMEHIDYILYPDLGAAKRYSEKFKFSVPYFCANKQRNLQTGEIIGFELINCPDIKDKNILIIDDLCVKGGTFMAAAQLLSQNGAKNISLYVTHCETQIFNGDILKSPLINKVFTTHSILNDYDKKITFVNIG